MVKNGATRRRPRGGKKSGRGIEKPNLLRSPTIMERSSKRVRMTLPPQHPVALLLDDAFRAFLYKRERRMRPIAPPQPFNILKELKDLNRYVEITAKHPDASVYLELPYDVQGLVRQFTPHPVSLLVKDAYYVWDELKHLRKHWPRSQEFRFKSAHGARKNNVKVAHFNWLQDRGNLDAWDRSGVTSGPLIHPDEDDWDYEPYYGW